MNFLSSFTNLSCVVFVDSENLIQPAFSIQIEDKNFVPVEFKAYPEDSINQYLITSSVIKGAKFSGVKSDLFKRIFAG